MSHPKKEFFPRVKEAREALAAKAVALFEMYETLIRDAIAAQDFETASKGLQFLMEHMPKDPDGTTMIDQSVDKREAKVKGGGGPAIQIGIAFGGVQPKRLEAPVIEGEVDEVDE